MAAQIHEITYSYAFVQLLCRFDGLKRYDLNTFKIYFKLIKYIDGASNSTTAPDMYINVDIADDGTLLFRYEQVLDAIPGLVKVREDMIISEHKKYYNPNIMTTPMITYQELKNMLSLAIRMPFYLETVHHMLESSFFIELESHVKNNQQTAFVSQMTNTIYDHLKVYRDSRFDQMITALPHYAHKFGPGRIIDPEQFPDLKQLVDALHVIFYGSSEEENIKRQRTS